MKPLELSLKALVPRRWEDGTRCLYCYSTILRYGVPSEPENLSVDFLTYIRELCAAFLRMRRTAFAAYEEMTVPTSRGNQPFVFVCAAHSCLEAMMAAVVAALTRNIELPNKIPGIRDASNRLKRTSPLLSAKIIELEKRPWCKLLYETRHKMVHRGYWFSGRAYPSGPSGTYLIRTPGLLEHSGFRTMPIGHSASEWEETDFQSIAMGLFLDLERWEIEAHDALRAEEKYASSLDCLMHFIPLHINDLHKESLGYLTKEQSREILCPVNI